MLSTAYMIRVGRVKGNKMVHMQLSNDKLEHRCASYIAQALGVSEEIGKIMLKKYGSVHAAIEAERS